jgi:hypothetical protein
VEVADWAAAGQLQRGCEGDFGRGAALIVVDFGFSGLCDLFC